MQDELTDAIWREDHAEVARLLQSGADSNAVDTKGWTPLMQAAEMESTEIIDLLLQNGADVNASGSDGATPLHIAVDIAVDGTMQTGRSMDQVPISTIARLLKAGARPAALNSNGESALDWARAYECQALIVLLSAAIDWPR